MGKITFKGGFVSVPKVEHRCPDCDALMVKRTNSQTGDEFFGCSTFPKCRGTRDEEGLTSEERREGRDEDVGEWDDDDELRWDRND